MQTPRQFELHSPLTPESCLEQLKASTETNRSIFGFLYSREKNVIGKFDGSSFHLRTNTSGSHAMLISLTGHLSPDGHGTRISAKFEITRYLYFYIPIIFAPALVSIIKTLSSGSPGDALAQPVVFLGLALLFLMIGGMIYFRYHLLFPEKEAQSLKQFLIAKLEATETHETQTTKTPTEVC